MPFVHRLVLLAAVLLVAGCDVAIDAPPTLGARYTLWGAFDPTADVQAIRVIPITDTVSLGSVAPLGVTVRSVDLATREETAWADTVVTFANGSVGHVYRAALRPAYGSRHAFTVTDGEGRETTALVSVPVLTEPVTLTPATQGGTAYPVFWPGAPRLNTIRVRYLVEDGDCGRTPLDRVFTGEAAAAEFGWTTVLRLRDEAPGVRAAFGGVRLSVRQITISAEIASEDWRPPGGVFDPEILVEPGVLSNVTGGFGFVGAAYRAERSWVPTGPELTSSGFEAPGFGGC